MACTAKRFASAFVCVCHLVEHEFHFTRENLPWLNFHGDVIELLCPARVLWLTVSRALAECILIWFFVSFLWLIDVAPDNDRVQYAPSIEFTFSRIWCNFNTIAFAATRTTYPFPMRTSIFTPNSRFTLNNIFTTDAEPLTCDLVDSIFLFLPGAVANCCLNPVVIMN